MEDISAATVAQWMQLGFAVAVAWYLLTQAIPRAEKRADERDKAFIEALNTQHDEHKGEVRAAYEHHEKQTDRVIDAINRFRPNGHDDRGSRG